MHTISQVLLNSETKFMLLSLPILCILPFSICSSILSFVRWKQSLAALSSWPSFTVESQGSLWFCRAHIWAAENRWSHQVCWLAPLQSHGLAPLLLTWRSSASSCMCLVPSLAQWHLSQIFNVQLHSTCSIRSFIPWKEIMILPTPPSTMSMDSPVIQTVEKVGNDLVQTLHLIWHSATVILFMFFHFGWIHHLHHLQGLQPQTSWS